MSRPTVIERILTINDVGANGTHQAGTLIPRKGNILDFFPPLDSSIKNPRIQMVFTDPEGINWIFNFIYYNNKLIEPKGTRNEYRLTGMTKYFKSNNLKPGDIIILSRDNDNNYFIKYRRAEDNVKIRMNQEGQEVISLKLSNTWKVINY